MLYVRCDNVKAVLAALSAEAQARPTEPPPDFRLSEPKAAVGRKSTLSPKERDGSLWIAVEGPGDAEALSRRLSTTVVDADVGSDAWRLRCYNGGRLVFDDGHERDERAEMHADDSLDGLNIPTDAFGNPGGWTAFSSGLSAPPPGP